jgi:hypothetical protein
VALRLRIGNDNGEETGIRDGKEDVKKARDQSKARTLHR